MRKRSFCAGRGRISIRGGPVSILVVDGHGRVKMKTNWYSAPLSRGLRVTAVVGPSPSSNTVISAPPGTRDATMMYIWVQQRAIASSPVLAAQGNLLAAAFPLIWNAKRKSEFAAGSLPAPRRQFACAPQAVCLRPQAVCLRVNA
jgi:hypothetical protein